jgi:hypothetical protein
VKKTSGNSSKIAGFIPLEIRALMALRQLATGGTSQEIALLFNVGEATARRFFLDFILNFSTKCFDEWVVPPSGTRLKEVMDVYARLGIPGTIGSMDVTHVRWDRCPIYERHLHVGKENRTFREDVTEPSCLIICLQPRMHAARSLAGARTINMQFVQKEDLPAPAATTKAHGPHEAARGTQCQVACLDA